MSPSNQITWVLFDLGGVLVRLGGVEDFGGLLGVSDEERLWEIWLGCEWVKRFERGQCAPDAFARGMVAEFRMPISPEQFLERFRRWPLGLQPQAREVVHALHGGIRSACLSNCNALHWDHSLRGFGLAELFPRRYLSHEVGLVKPDAAFFEYVIGDLAVEPHRVLFLDDNRANVSAARAQGLLAERVLNPAEAARVLVDLGLADPLPAPA